MTQVSRTYGQALWDLAHDEGLSHRILAELSVLEVCFRESPGFLQLLSAPNIPLPQRFRVLDEALGSQVHPYLLHFLKLLTERGHARHFPDCSKWFRRQYNRANGILAVTAITAAPLPEDLRGTLTEILSQRTGKTVELHCRVDPACLGGVRLEFDGKQVDGTLRRRLDDLRTTLRHPPQKAGTSWN